MVYAYAWYEMFGIMLGAGVAIFLVIRGLDRLLEGPMVKFMDKVNARRVRRDLEELDSDGA